MKYILFFFISLGISETNWTYTRVEANDPISNTLFGYSVAMNGMGNKVITSAIGYNYNAGKVYKFIEIENQWIQEYILEPNFGANQGDCQAERSIGWHPDFFGQRGGYPQGWNFGSAR